MGCDDGIHLCEPPPKTRQSHIAITTENSCAPLSSQLSTASHPARRQLIWFHRHGLLWPVFILHRNGLIRYGFCVCVWLF